MNCLAVISFMVIAVSSLPTIFFHEPSSVLLHPDVYENHSDFGFAMGFQPVKNKLVVGATSVSLEGKVYSCDMEHAAELSEISCRRIDIKVPSTTKGKQHFYLGSSIAATSEYFLTCAPLWTYMTHISKYVKYPDAVGTCFIVHGENIQKYKGIYEQYTLQRRQGRVKNINTNAFLGGTGWTTLVDDDNGLLLIVKSTLQGDIAYTSLSKPNTNTKSMVLTKALKEINNTFLNFGYGFTSGKFFSNKTVYAFSAYNTKMEGIIEFLKYDSKSQKFSLMNQNIINKMYTIHNKNVATMFGSTLVAADLNMDGFSDLLAGAPTYSAEDCAECGAVYIYMGGETENIGDRNKLQIIGNVEFGRFSTAIVAKDLDGDGKPEIAISAPYQDQGSGAVYILSGYELYQLLQLPDFLQVTISDLKYTQKLQNNNLRNFGYSLQFISDTDDNGCDELVVGSPGNGTAVLLKCVAVVNITVSHSNLQTVRELDNNFTIEVCVKIEYPKMLKHVSANLIVTYSIIGEAVRLLTTESKLNVSCDEIGCLPNNPFCENVTAVLIGDDPGEYKFSSKVELLTDHLLKSSEFNRSWVVASPYSDLYKMKRISRHCKDDDCLPKLSINMSWSRSNQDDYVLGSSTHENAKIVVLNEGSSSSSYEACVYIQVNGASLSQNGILRYCTDYMSGYSCQLLPKPFKRLAQRSIELLFDMTAPTNKHTHLFVKAVLYEKCYTESTINGTAYLNISYKMPTNDIYVAGSNHTKIITDKQILSETNMDTVLDTQEYLVTNNGIITWKKVIARIIMRKKSFIYKFKVSTIFETTCKESHTDHQFICTCILLDVRPNSTYKIIATTEILKMGIEQHMTDNKINIMSEMKLFLLPTNKTIKEISESVIVYREELTFASNKWFIGILAVSSALLILLIIFTILYRRGFFKRKEKQKLRVLRESFRQRDSRRNTHISSAGDGQGLQGVLWDDDDDSAFEDTLFPKTEQIKRLPKIEEYREDYH